MKLLIPTVICYFFSMLTPVFSYSEFNIRFVTKVPRSCKHLGDLRAEFKGKSFYQLIKSYKVWNANRLFSKELRHKAKKIGANRLVVVDLFHNVKEYHNNHGKTWTKIYSTEVRARAFRCRG